MTDLPLFSEVWSSVREDLKEPRPRLDEIKRQLRTFLAAAATSGPVTAKDLAERLGTTERGIRHASKELLEEGIAVVSGPQGFFMARSRVELAAYLDNLVARMQGIERDVRAVERILGRMG